MKLKKVACLGLAAMVALGALGCGSDNKAADNKAQPWGCCWSYR